MTIGEFDAKGKHSVVEERSNVRKGNDTEEREVVGWGYGVQMEEVVNKHPTG